jgi:prevent-host-death family protein
MAMITILKFRREFEAFLRYARCRPIEITRHGRRAFVLMSAEQHDWVRAAGRRAYRTTNATTVVINSVRLAEMDANHAALDELLNETRRRASIQHREQQDGVRRAFRRSNAMKYMPRSFQPSARFLALRVCLQVIWTYKLSC